MAEKLEEKFAASSMRSYEELPAVDDKEKALHKRHEEEEPKSAKKVKAFITLPDEDLPEPANTVLNLVLLGKTGVGKSQTGNLIMGQDDFNTSSSTQSCTQTIKASKCKIKGVTVHVVDTPGIFDTRKDAESVATELLKVGLIFEEGIHAFCFLRSFGSPRFTPEEWEAFDTFTKLFSNVALQHCVFIITRADEIFYMNDLLKKTVEGWATQNLDGGTIYESVGKRVLGVENIRCTASERQMQRERLISFFQSMVAKKEGETYGQDIFKEAQAEYEETIKREKVIRKKEVQMELESVRKKYEVREREREAEWGWEKERHIPGDVMLHLMHKTRPQLAVIALGNFEEDVNELCMDPFLAEHRGTVKRYLKSFAGILVNKTYLGKIISFSTRLFNFAQWGDAVTPVE